MDCLFHEGESIPNLADESKYVVGKGVMMNCAFHPQRLESHKAEIRQLLAQLPHQFSEGGGWSFLNACVTEAGDQWGEHQNIDQLLMLGVASKLAEYCLPREFWPVLPGGMPYFKVV